MVMSHNRPINTDEQDISFFKPTTFKSKQQSIQGLYHIKEGEIIFFKQCFKLQWSILYFQVYVLNVEFKQH